VGVRRGKLVWGVVLGSIGVVGVVALGVVLAMMLDETHLERPSAHFDALTAEVASVPGVTVDHSERWVEAPTFARPQAALAVTVDAASLTRFVETLCASGYAEPLMTSVSARTAVGTRMALYADADHGVCPDYGFDAPAVLALLDEIVPGQAIQPAEWDSGFAFTAMEGPASGFAHLLPLVVRSDELRVAVELPAATPLAVDGMTLGVRFLPADRQRYVALLEQVLHLGAVTFSASDADEQTDGVARVQIAAPENARGAIERAVRASGLALADDEIRFFDP